MIQNNNEGSNNPGEKKEPLLSRRRSSFNNNNNAREIPTFANTTAWSSRFHLLSGTNVPKRSITVIDEASV